MSDSGSGEQIEDDSAYPDEALLVAALKRGDRVAFREAVVRFSPQMLAVATRIVGAYRAQDSVQEAWLTVFQKINGFQRRSALSTWLQRIVTNHALSELRRQARETSLTDSDDAGLPLEWFDSMGGWAAPPPAWDFASPDDFLTAEDLQNCIDKHLTQMPTHQRLVVILRDMEMQSFEDICNNLSLSASNVRVLLHRGRLRLMEMINRFQETGSC